MTHCVILADSRHQACRWYTGSTGWVTRRLPISDQIRSVGYVKKKRAARPEYTAVPICQFILETAPTLLALPLSTTAARACRERQHSPEESRNTRRSTADGKAPAQPAAIKPRVAVVVAAHIDQHPAPRGGALVLGRRPPDVVPGIEQDQFIGQCR